MCRELVPCSRTTLFVVLQYQKSIGNYTLLVLSTDGTTVVPRSVLPNTTCRHHCYSTNVSSESDSVRRPGFSDARQRPQNFSGLRFWPGASVNRQPMWFEHWRHCAIVHAYLAHHDNIAWSCFKVTEVLCCSKVETTRFDFRCSSALISQLNDSTTSRRFAVNRHINVRYMCMYRC